MVVVDAVVVGPGAVAEVEEGAMVAIRVRALPVDLLKVVVLLARLLVVVNSAKVFRRRRESLMPPEILWRLVDWLGQRQTLLQC